MTWSELKLLLEDMSKTGHSCLTGTPAVRVTVVFDNEEYYLDLAESLTTGKLTFVPCMVSKED